jgi:GntR family transcriptional regulator
MLSGDGPIFQQLADRIADEIMSGTFAEESSVPSTNEYAVFFSISPITATKAVNVLVEQGVLYKKRGIGMFVTPGARELLRARRREEFRGRYVSPLLREARLLGIQKSEVTTMFDEEGHHD